MAMRAGVHIPLHLAMSLFISGLSSPIQIYPERSVGLDVNECLQSQPSLDPVPAPAQMHGIFQAQSSHFVNAVNVRKSNSVFRVKIRKTWSGPWHGYKFYCMNMV